MCLPDSLGSKTTVAFATDRINDWLESLEKREQTLSLDLPKEIHSKLNALLTKQEMERILKTRFDQRDVSHLRNQILLRNIAERITKRKNEKETDILQDCTDLFYYTMRNVALIEEKDAVPFRTFGILLWGRGTVHDRAWIFASLLKQYTKTPVDAVILKPKTGSSKSHSSNFLVGLMIHSASHKGKVYLYDPLLGIPLPSDKGDSKPFILVERPCTLEEFTRDDTVFERLRTRSNEYRLKPQDLKNVDCQIVSNTSYLSPRSKLLQYYLNKNQQVLVYENLFDVQENATIQNSGLFDRVSRFSAKSWTSKDVTLWHFPEETIRRYDHLKDNPDIERKVERIVKTFGAPYGSDIINEHFRSRVAQLMGRNSEALERYLRVKFGYSLDTTGRQGTQASESSVLNALAASDAAFWTGIVKIEQNKFDAAIDLLRVYSKKNQENPNYFGHCMFWLGYAQMKSRKFAAGVQSLSRIPDSVPIYRTGRFFLAKWRAIRDSQ